MATIAAPAIATARPARGLLRIGTVSTVGCDRGRVDRRGRRARGRRRGRRMDARACRDGRLVRRRRRRTRGGGAPRAGSGSCWPSSGCCSRRLAQRLDERRRRTRSAAWRSLRSCCTSPTPSSASPATGSRRGRAPARRAFAVASAVLWLVTLPLVETLPASGPLVDCGGVCPDNAFQLVETPGRGLVGAGVHRERRHGPRAARRDRAARRTIARAGDLRRRLVLPVLGSAIALAAAYAAYTLLRELDVGGLTGLKVVGAVAALAIPLAMLVGQVRGRVFTATSVVDLVGRDRRGADDGRPGRGPAARRDRRPAAALRPAHGQASGYVDVEGNAVELPVGRRDVGVTPVLRNGEPVAALVHDAALDEGSGITEGLAATALMLLENAQLVTELRDSRARIVASGQQERLRLERNLHDGAQQRLFTHPAQADGGTRASPTTRSWRASWTSSRPTPRRPSTSSGPRSRPVPDRAARAGAGRRPPRGGAGRGRAGAHRRRRGRAVRADGRGGGVLLRAGGDPEHGEARRARARERRWPSSRTEATCASR